MRGGVANDLDKQIEVHEKLRDANEKYRFIAEGKHDDESIIRTNSSNCLQLEIFADHSHKVYNNANSLG
jgi:hypothetical protein